jgi:putative acyl-CoA dehydrogenase
MQNVLADLVLESEAATALAMRVARSFDNQQEEKESIFKRAITPAVKYWICKRSPAVGVEAMEVLGGNGYVEEGVMARVYREMPLNSIWEGSGNVMCLDVLRAFSKTPEALEVVREEWQDAKKENKALSNYAQNLENELSKASKSESDGRRLTERLAICISASLLVRFAPAAISDAFCSSRLGADWGNTFGTLESHVNFKEIIARGMPIEHKAAKEKSCI